MGRIVHGVLEGATWRPSPGCRFSVEPPSIHDCSWRVGRESKPQSIRVSRVDLDAFAQASFEQSKMSYLTRPKLAIAHAKQIRL